ncbi:MAG: ATP-dependent zinc metalloprotease FtsH [Deltaproteobacteria bacterium]|nr:ATP-dependent zinc metalloprotease FtsH [Deltaproteobacteria bacterium]
MEPKHKRQLKFSGWYFFLAFAVLYLLQTALLGEIRPEKVPYSEFLSLLEQGKIASVNLREREIVAELVSKDNRENKNKIILTERLPNINESLLLEKLYASKVRFQGKIETDSWLKQFFLGWVLPLGILVLLYLFIMRRIGRNVGPLSFGKSKVKIYDNNEKNKVTFDDVAGIDEAKAELTEVLDFLRNPEKYRALGATIPKGVLLVGPPGTGKTLMARALAGEANVPFFTLSGSDFVEMFVGVGAARVRDLFAQAKERAPCIVFIDEIDAIGKSRGGIAAMATNDEREQTLNQLLSEMDGFDSTKGVIIMAATNRPEVLDSALLRAGRFDRQVVVDRADVRGRESILKVHARPIKLGDDVNFTVIAQRTPGMTGADLANVVNQAALNAARRGSSVVESRDFDEAVDRIQLGTKNTSKVMNEDEKRRVAFHESGHAIVAMSVEHADPVYKVTIIPSSIGALGATLQLPTEDRYMMTKNELFDRICVMMGGRAAEELCCQDISTGAQNDLERVTETARQMVCRYGMSELLGPQTFGRPTGLRFLGGPMPLGEDRNFSEKTAQAIDAEVRQIIDTQHQRARKILQDRRDMLGKMIEKLLVEETLHRSDLEAIVGPLPQRRATCSAQPAG